MPKTKTFAQISSIAKSLKKRGKRIVFTNGCFDILHYGHLRYLGKCKSLGDILIVGLNSDSSVKKIKGRNRPVTRQKERAALLSALEPVDYVVMFNGKTPKRLIEKVSPDVLAKGGDWKEADIVGGAFVKARGGKVISVPFVRGYSTTNIIRRIKNT